MKYPMKVRALSPAGYWELQNRGRAVYRIRGEEKLSSPGDWNVFISHVTKDNDLITGAVDLIKENGGRVFIDIESGEISSLPVDRIAAALKLAITVCKKLIVLHTPGITDSVWVPWELALCDGKFGAESVAIFPVEENIEGPSFLSLYRQIGKGIIGDKEVWCVWSRVTKKAEPLKDWFNRESFTNFEQE